MKLPWWQFRPLISADIVRLWLNYGSAVSRSLAMSGLNRVGRSCWPWSLLSELSPSRRMWMASLTVFMLGHGADWEEPPPPCNCMEEASSMPPGGMEQNERRKAWRRSLLLHAIASFRPSSMQFYGNPERKASASPIGTYIISSGD